jgi:hypothetical protein
MEDWPLSDRRPSGSGGKGEGEEFRGKGRLELVVVVLAEAGRDKGAGLRRADGLARARLGENDVPEVGVGRSESHADKTALALFAKRGDVALRGLSGHLVEKTDVLAGDEGRIHEQQRPVRTYNISGRLQVNRLAFGKAATNLHGNLKRQADGSTTLWVSGSLHKKGF